MFFPILSQPRSIGMATLILRRTALQRDLRLRGSGAGAVAGGEAYAVLGYAVRNSADLADVWLRVRWYSSADGFGPPLLTSDVAHLTIDDAAYQQQLVPDPSTHNKTR